MRSKQLTICLSIFHMGGSDGESLFGSALSDSQLDFFFMCVARRKRKERAHESLMMLIIMIFVKLFTSKLAKIPNIFLSPLTFFLCDVMRTIHKSCKQLFKHAKKNHFIQSYWNGKSSHAQIW